jgi:uncharacterized protein (DUF58 family)
MPATVGFRRAGGVALAGVALIVVGLTFDASPLFVPGVAFAVLGAGAPLWVWLVSRGASIERRLHCDRVNEGDPLEARIEVRGGPLGLSGSEVHDPLSGEPLLLRGGGRAATVRVIAQFERRGMHRLEPPVLLIRDPLGLAERLGRPRAGADQVLVLPRTERVRWAAGGGERGIDATIARRRAELSATVAVDGLRPYQPGTPASRIYWQGLARGAGLLERHLRPESDGRPLVVLDARGSGPEQDLDAAVRATASLVLELGRRGGCWLLLPDERRPLAIDPELMAWPGAHARLALVTGGAGTSAPLLGSARTRSGPVFYVAAVELERPPAALARGAVVLVTPTGASARTGARPVFEVSGCTAFAVGRTAPVPSHRARQPALAPEGGGR